MAAQFIRIEAFSAKEAYRVTAEANREDGFCGHVEKPKPPKWLVGCAEDVKVAVDDYMDTLTHITCRSGKKSTRKRRSDHRCFLGGVTSWPVPVKDYEKQNSTEKKRFQDWLRASKSWLESRFGENLKGIVAHGDEGYLHLHFFVVGDANQHHPGLAAEFVDGVRLSSRSEKGIRYVSAMQTFLDEAHEAVGNEYGLDRSLGGNSLPRIKDRATYLRVRALQKDIEVRGVRDMHDRLDQLAEEAERPPSSSMVF